MARVRLIAEGRRDSEADKLSHYRSAAISAAEDFHYGIDTIRAIENAKTETEISKIMERRRRSCENCKTTYRSNW